jgi:hypothetical protein
VSVGRGRGVPKPFTMGGQAGKGWADHRGLACLRRWSSVSTSDRAVCNSVLTIVISFRNRDEESGLLQKV